MIRGELNTEGDWPQVVLPGMPELVESDHGDWQTITLHADFPIPVSHAQISPEMQSFFSPFLLARSYLGDDLLIYAAGMSRFRALVDTLDDFQRTYHLHVRSQWDLVNTNIARLFDNWDTNASAAECQTFLHQSLYLAISVVDPIGKYPNVKRELWSRVFKQSSQFAQEAYRLEREGRLRKLQQRVSHQLFSLIRHSDHWAAAVPIIYARAKNKGVPDNWRIPGDNFTSLRDAYRQNFELSCQMLNLFVRMQNISEGRSADTIRPDTQANQWIPRDFPKGGKLKPPTTTKQFERLNSATKELYLNRSKHLRDLWSTCFERNLRNAISHADADYNIGTGVIHTNRADKTYHDFLVSVAWQVPLLTLWLDLIKLWRIYAMKWDPVNSSLLCD
ncbi:hypothetical protein [Streptomyces asiaticus]